MSQEQLVHWQWSFVIGCCQVARRASPQLFFPPVFFIWFLFFFRAPVRHCAAAGSDKGAENLCLLTCRQKYTYVCKKHRCEAFKMAKFNSSAAHFMSFNVFYDLKIGLILFLWNSSRSKVIWQVTISVLQGENTCFYECKSKFLDLFKNAFRRSCAAFSQHKCTSTRSSLQCRDLFHHVMRTNSRWHLLTSRNSAAPPQHSRKQKGN